MCIRDRIETANESFVDRRYVFGTFEWQSSSFELTEMQHYSVLAPLADISGVDGTEAYVTRNGSVHRCDRKGFNPFDVIDLFIVLIHFSVRIIQCFLWTFGDRDQVVFDSATHLHWIDIRLDSIEFEHSIVIEESVRCLLYTSPSPRDKRQSRMPSSA